MYIYFQSTIQRPLKSQDQHGIQAIRIIRRDSRVQLLPPRHALVVVCLLLLGLFPGYQNRLWPLLPLSLEVSLGWMCLELLCPCSNFVFLLLGLHGRWKKMNAQAPLFCSDLNTLQQWGPEGVSVSQWGGVIIACDDLAGAKQQKKLVKG